jgi:predicted DNA-binding protein
MIDDGAKQRIKEQSKQVATYIQAQNEITNFLDELEEFHFVREVFCDDIDRGDHKAIEKWLIAAWQLGYEAGRQRGTN